MGLLPSRRTIQALGNAVVGKPARNAKSVPVSGGASSIYFSAADRILGRDSSGAGVGQELACTAFARSLLDDANAATARTTLGLGSTDSPTFAAVTLSTITAASSAGLAFKSTGGSTCLTLGAGGGCNATFGDGCQVTGQLQANATTESTSTTTGSLVVAGGAGVAKDLNVGGRITEDGTFAEIHLHDGSTAQSITNGTTYIKSTAFTDNGLSSNCTADVSNDKITVTKVGRYRVSGSFSFTCGTNNVVWSCSAFVGGTEQDQVHWQRKVGTGADIGAASFDGFVTVSSANTDIDVRFRHDQGAAVDLTLVYANLNVQYVGEIP